jgi:hypothetical protein
MPNGSTRAQSGGRPDSSSLSVSCRDDSSTFENPSCWNAFGDQYDGFTTIVPSRAHGPATSTVRLAAQVVSPSTIARLSSMAASR